MNTSLHNFLHESATNGKLFESVVDSHSKQIVKTLGGWSTVIALCLANANAKQYIQSNNINQFINILRQNNIVLSHDKSISNQQSILDLGSTAERVDGSPSLFDSDHEETNINQLQGININRIPISRSVSQENLNSYKSDDQSTTQASGKTLSTISSNNSTSQMTVSNMVEYYQSSIVVTCHTQDNLCFDLFSKLNLDDKHKHLPFSVYNTITSKQYTFLMIAILCILMVIWIVLVHSIDVGSNVGRNIYIIGVLGVGVSIIYTLSLFIIANITIVNLVLNTFDFWYKLINVFIIFFVQGVYRWFDNNTSNSSMEQAPIGVAVLRFIGFLTIYSSIFAIDAFPISITLKRVTIISITGYTLYYAIALFFTVEDYVWNPFGENKSTFGKYTQISFKSILVSSAFNLAIFALKPIYGDIMRFCRRKIGEPNTQDDTSGQDLSLVNDYARCYCVYKRPYVKWYKKTETESSSLNSNLNGA